MRVIWSSGAALVERWAQQLRAVGQSVHTVRLRTHAVAACSTWAGVDPAKLSRDDVLWWLEAHPQWSANTRNAYWRSLHVWFAWCVGEGVLTEHPLHGVRGPAARPGRPRPVTTAEVTGMLAVAPDPATRVWILLAALQGLRVAEIATLRGEDFRGGTMRVRGKGGHFDVLPLHPQVELLVEQMPRTGWWFPSPGSAAGHVHPKTVTRKVALTMRRAGVTDGAAHRLRHWFGTEALRATRNVRTVQTLLRHRSIATTQVYTLIDEDEQAAALRALPDLSA